MSRRGGRRNARGATRQTLYPATLSPYVWIEADNGVSQSSSRISAWVSKANSISFAQATGANQLLYVASDAAYNNRAIVQIDDTARFMAATVSIPFPMSTFEYGEYTATGTYDKAIFGPAATTMAWHHSGGNQRIYGNEGGNDFAPSIPDASNEKRSLYRGLAASAVITLARNAGTPVTGSNANLPVSRTMIDARIGHSGGSRPQKLAAYFIFRRELTSQEITNLHAWCVAKYG